MADDTTQGAATEEPAAADGDETQVTAAEEQPATKVDDPAPAEPQAGDQPTAGE